MDGGMMRLIDEAHWKQPPEPASSPEFALVTSNNGGKEQLSIKSPFLLSLFENIIKTNGIMGMTKGSKAISFPEPYVPLYWCYNQIIQSGSDAENLSQQDTKDLQSLRYWYEKWAFVAHNQLRDTIHSGFVTFVDLWALFGRGETLYGLDRFDQVELGKVMDVNYLHNQASHGATPDGRMPMGSVPLYNSFVIKLWFQDWDPSRQVLVKKLSQKLITPFDGSRRIIDLGVYPLRFFGGGDQTKIETLHRTLERRGRRWKELVGPSAQHLYHEGPAEVMRTEMGGFSATNALNDKHVWPSIIERTRCRTANQTWSQLAARVVVDPFSYIETFRDHGRMPPPPGFETAQEVPEEQSPANEFSSLQARLCPSTLQCCVPRTATWYTVTVDNLQPITYKKEAMDALVIPRDTKDMLIGLIEEHQRNESQGAITDFIANKGEV
ncbi:hypothetical protein Daus18300_002317 [Diaporthe australafricana]|uniref:DUF7025 domain-containing protein n=1 Tax=Diaporthe australafricana TaxID=127596 RepID=A0ABR3XQT2_9PEZI